MNILLLEDDIILNEIIEEFLISQNYSVTNTMDGDLAEELIYENHYDLLLLDVNVPNQTGFDLLKTLKNNDIQIPTIFITSLNTPEDVKLGFNYGCDDYIKKPFDLSELHLRIQNISRLRNIRNFGIEKLTNNISYDLNTKMISNEGEKSTLSKTESKIFEYLLKNKNRTVSINEISMNNWVYDEMPTETTIRTYIKNLRKFLGKDRITTIKGIGYRLVIDSDYSI
jgi:DNA-binding response OmpR family regulator